MIHTQRLGLAMVACAATLLAATAGDRSPTEAIGVMSLPGTPGAPEAIAGDTRAIVAVPEPASGGTPDGYVVTASPGGGTCTIPASASLRVCTINALANGVAYTFAATATNSSGTSPVSAASNSITPGDMLAYDTALTLKPGSGNIMNVLVMDPAGEFLLAGARYGPIYKIRLPEMVNTGQLALSVGDGDLWSGTMDAQGASAYFGTLNRHVIKVDVSTMTRVTTSTLTVDEGRAQVMLHSNGSVYAVTASDPGKVVKFDASLNPLSTVTLSARGAPQSAVLSPDGRYLYVGHRKWPEPEARVSRVDLQNFTDAAVVFAAVAAGDSNLTSMVLGHDEHLYIGTETSPGRVLKVSTSGLTREAAVTLPSGDDSLYFAVSTPDRRQVYVSTNVSPSSTIWKFDLAASGSPGYTTVSSITVPADDTQVAAMVMDPFGHRLYFGANTGQDRVVAVTVGPAPRRLPVAPPTVAATASETSADITWQAPADTGGLTIQGFAVEQASSHSGPWTPAGGGCALANTRASTAVACTATGLTNQDYVFRVATRTTGGQGAWASISAAVTPTGTTTTTTTTTVALPTSPSPIVTQPSPTVVSGTTTVPTATTIPSTSTPPTSLAPVPQAAVTPGVVNGNAVSVSDGQLALRVEPVACDGASCGVSTAADGRPTITLSQSGRVRVSGDGFQPGTLAQVWMFSEPQFLGVLPVAVDGSFGGELDVPPVEPGDHTLQVHGLTPAGESRSAELGLRVLAAVVAVEAGELPATGGGSSGALVMALLLALVGAVLALHPVFWPRPRRFGCVQVRRQRPDLW